MKPGSRVSKAKLLLVDDRPENLLAFESLLEDFDVDLLQARSGEEALKLLLHHDVALVILDVQMPGMDGYEVASLMQKGSRTRATPIIFVSATIRDMEHILRGYQSGAADFLTKPIDPVIFRNKVQVFLELERKSRELELSHMALEESLEDVRRLKEYNELLLNSIGEGIITLDSDGIISYANPAAMTLLGIDGIIVGNQIRDYLAEPEPDQLVATLLGHCMAEKTWEGHVHLHRRENNFPAELTATPFRKDGDGETAGITLVFEDITERQKREKELLRASEHDALTGLTNRRGFERILEERLQHERSRMSLLFIDLDDFKPVNDELGHQSGDLVLRELAERFARVTRDSDLVARLGGDEFCVLAHLSQREESSGVIAEKLLEAARETIPVDGREISVGASIGIAIPHFTTSAGELVEAADRAMYQAKRSGGGTWRLIHCHV